MRRSPDSSPNHFNLPLLGSITLTGLSLSALIASRGCAPSAKEIQTQVVFDSLPETRIRFNQTLSHSGNSEIFKTVNAPIALRSPDKIADPILEDCLAIYAQKQPISTYFALNRFGEQPFEAVLEGRCHYLDSSIAHYFEPNFPYNYCKGEIKIDEDPELAEFSIDFGSLSENRHQPVFNPSLYDEEEIGHLRACVEFYRIQGIQTLEAESILVDQQAFEAISRASEHGCEFEYDSDLYSLKLSPPAEFKVCGKDLPNELEEEIDNEKTEILVNQVGEFALGLIKSASYDEAFALITPAYLHLEKKLILGQIKDPDQRREMSGYLESLIKFIEEEPNDPKAVCSSMYKAYDIPSRFPQGNSPKLLELLYRVVLEGKDGCSFRDL